MKWLPPARRMHSPLLILMLLSRVAHASFMTPAAARAPRIAAARCARLTAVASVDAPAPPRRKVKDIGEAAIGDTVVLKGWVRSVRGQKAFSFIDLNDGSSMNGMQVVAKAELDTYDVVGALSTGAALAVEGFCCALQVVCDSQVGDLRVEHVEGGGELEHSDGDNHVEYRV